MVAWDAFSLVGHNKVSLIGARGSVELYPCPHAPHVVARGQSRGKHRPQPHRWRTELHYGVHVRTEYSMRRAGALYNNMQARQ